MSSRRFLLSSRPSPQRICAVALIVLQAVLLWKLMSGGPFALLSVLIACAGATTRPERLLPSYDLPRWSLIIAVVFLLKARFLPHEIGSLDGFVYSQYAFEIASALIAVQLLILWGREYHERLPVVTLALAGMGLIFIGDSRVSDFERMLTSSVAGLYCVGAVLFASYTRSEIPADRSSARHWRTAMWTIPVVVGSLMGQALGVWLFRNEQHLETLLTKLIETGEESARAGFSGEAGLNSSSWFTEGNEDVVLQISGTSQQLYLKGQSLNRFRRSQWTSTYSLAPLDPVLMGRLRDYAGPNSRVFAVTESGEVAVDRILDVWPQPAGKAVAFFLPPTAIGFVTEAVDLSHDRAGNARRAEPTDPQHYQVLISDEMLHRPLPAEEREDYLQLPRQIDDRVVDTAVQIFAEARSTKDRIERVERYFRDNFGYQLGISVPIHEDPLGWFLENKIPAHCEYFATATAILLRLEGIPTRLTTGYVAAEWNAAAELLIVRRKDAHAWVEAYDDEAQRWVIVESTPADGVPQSRETGRIDAWGQSIQHLGMRWSEAIQRWSQQDFGSFAGVYLVALLLLTGGALALALYRHRLWSLFVLDPVISRIPPDLRRERQRLDRRLSRAGLERRKSETLHQFANRIEETVTDEWGRQAAECYRVYARLRFDVNAEASTLTLDGLMKLRKRL